MKNTNELKNYRTKYKRYYGIEFGKEYAVHHIDGNRKNNDIDNLVLLPAQLHSKYHFLKTIIEGQRLPTAISGNALNSQSYYLNALEDFLKVLKECNRWYDYKMYLEGCIPNIHKINLGVIEWR